MVTRVTLSIDYDTFDTGPVCVVSNIMKLARRRGRDKALVGYHKRWAQSWCSSHSRKGNETMRRVIMLVLGLNVLLVCTAAFAQTETGQIFGKVTDPQGALLKGATVTIKSLATGTKVTATTRETATSPI